MKAIVLTGGQGTRLRPLTLSFPKPLLPIVNEPFLSYPFSLLKNNGVDCAVLCAASSPKPYLKALNRERSANFKIEISTETKPLGTGGAIKNAEKFLQDEENFFVMNGDILTDVPLKPMLALHKKTGAWVTVAFISVPDPSAFGLGVLSPSGRIQKFVEKPSLSSLPKKKSYPVNAGIYIYRREVLALMPRGVPFSVERDLYPKLLERKLPAQAFLAPEKVCWIDIGTPEKFLLANREVLLGRTSFTRFRRIHAVAKSAKIHPSAKLSHDSIIGPKVVVGPKAQITSSILLEGVKVEAEAQIRNAIIGKASLIGANAQVFSAQVLGENSHITAYSKL
jgi:mannose-1-phosphate guanylyltransferase